MSHDTMVEVAEKQKIILHKLSKLPVNDYTQILLDLTGIVVNLSCIVQDLIDEKNNASDTNPYMLHGEELERTLKHRLED